MPTFFRTAALTALLATTAPALRAQTVKELTYTVTMDPAANSNEFQVKLQLPRLKKSQDIYQFAATAPGTYQVMDMGRFVRRFEAFDAKGKPLGAKQLSTNQWQLANPKKTREIRYTIAETWDTPVQEHPIYLMCGSSLEADHALLNGQTILGYPEDMQNAPLRLKLNYPKDWKAGTVLVPDAQGYYRLDDYDYAVDSPILVGRLTEASTELGDADVALYCYSATDKVQAEPLLGYMQKMLNAAQAFLGGNLPVKRYAFLYHFADKSAGAWEHSYSSEYVLRETPLTAESARNVVDIAAHEFFHIVTPLNIHSEIIEQFNFVNPTGSEHLWLYEGVTEWASHTMQLRGGLVSLDDYLETLHDKVVYDRTRADSTYSLSKLGLNSFGDEGQRQYGNIYQRGALTATLLDLRLLELSGGKRGLREVLLELAKKYGPDKPISEKNFFQDFTRLTYPEIGDFFARYIQQAEPLPLQEYFAKVGIRYNRSLRTGRQIATLGQASYQVRGDEVYFTALSAPLQAAGVRQDDQLAGIDGTFVDRRNFASVIGQVKSRPAGSELSLTIRRDGKEQPVRVRLGATEEVKSYDFAPDPNATPAQLALREAWMKNL
ncbi:peptidase M61 domain protein [Hymenobacter roseosalivarius DSM 11622]|uniref:Peptidase M61 domain protein n=1 Tax=Hymenobacter roseosalivarius DSM 11622 TaxID=645990 RepID=A0A1W1VYJ5_9BACT|nr:PDZ domain-containing protein [Hymenobacter roseosalivarius]SMB98333.1 peptidase M61 domain protein [Hymenobacter roseosalivarius DSM 11622]